MDEDRGGHESGEAGVNVADEAGGSKSTCSGESVSGAGVVCFSCSSVSSILIDEAVVDNILDGSSVRWTGVSSCNDLTAGGPALKVVGGWHTRGANKGCGMLKMKCI